MVCWRLSRAILYLFLGVLWTSAGGWNVVSLLLELALSVLYVVSCRVIPSSALLFLYF